MVTSTNYKLTPGFDEAKSYENWKNEVEMWKRVMDLDEKKQALAVALSRKGRARDIALEIPADELDKDNGMTTLIQELDKVFMREEKDRAYEAYSEFDRISRKDDVPMGEYIADYEQKYNKIHKFNMVLPDAVLAFKQLDTAVLDVKDKQLALTACGTHTFADMKSALKRVFGEKTEGKAGTISMSKDAVYYTDNRRGQSQAQSSQARGPLAGTNPVDKFGRLAQEQSVAKSDYVQGLDESEIQRVINMESSKPFKFGDGKVVHSIKKVKIPAKLGKAKCCIETEVVPCDIPLLLSKASLKRAGAGLDLENDTATMLKQQLALEVTSSGHYCINISGKDSTSDT